MKIETINRAHLETLSFSDLSTLADEYGLDVPENLDRRFLISELLELSEEDDEEEDMEISSEESGEQVVSLPKNYNETQISCVLRNPSWLFCFWNISESDQVKLRKLGSYTLMLRVCCLADKNQPIPEDAYEIQVVSDTQEQYVLLPSDKKYIKVELVYVTETAGKVLAFSPVIKIPQGSALVTDLHMGRDTNFSEILQLSGMNKILTYQYKNHRHSAMQ